MPTQWHFRRTAYQNYEDGKTNIIRTQQIAQIMQSKYKQCLNRLSQIIDSSISNCMSFLMSSVQRFETETLADMSEIHIHNYESLDKH